MSLAVRRMPTSLGGGGNYRVPSHYSASSSYGIYHASPEDFIASFYAVLRRWQSETTFLSDPNEITGRPSFAALVSHAELVTPLIIEELRSRPSLLVWVLDDAFDDHPYRKEDTGDIEAMTNAWIAWAERNGRAL